MPHIVTCYLLSIEFEKLEFSAVGVESSAISFLSILSIPLLSMVWTSIGLKEQQRRKNANIEQTVNNINNILF